MAGSIRESLGPSLHHLVDAFFDRAKIEETRADCNRCSMCDHGDPSPVAMDYFHSETKCCTFWPSLSNYQVGAILADTDASMAEGRRRIQKAIASRIGVTPRYLSRPRKWTLLMTGYQDAFGRTTALKCPYYDDDNPVGNCSIWRHREAVCSTYYCKYSGGQRGFSYWTALRKYLQFVEAMLANRAAQAVDPKLVEPEFKRGQLTVEDMEDRPAKAADYAVWWGDWAGREEEFYLRCHEWVKGVSRAEFQQSVDRSEQGKRFLDDVIAKYELLENKVLPKNLVRNKRMQEKHAGDKVVVTTYHRYDSFALDRDLFDVVGMFRADQTLDQNLERLKTEEGIELVPELVDFLFYAGILVEPNANKDSEGAAPSREQAGELNGRRAALKAVLEARGFIIGPAVVNKLARANLAKLDWWIKRAVKAKTIDEVLKD